MCLALQQCSRRKAALVQKLTRGHDSSFFPGSLSWITQHRTSQHFYLLPSLSYIPMGLLQLAPSALLWISWCCLGEIDLWYQTLLGEFMESNDREHVVWRQTYLEGACLFCIRFTTCWLCDSGQDTLSSCALNKVVTVIVKNSDGYKIVPSV